MTPAVVIRPWPSATPSILEGESVTPASDRSAEQVIYSSSNMKVINSSSNMKVINSPSNMKVINSPSKIRGGQVALN